jgi:predicted choloylglycine hydrolase
VLEECTTIAEAEKLLRSLKRTTTTCLAISDKNGSAVFEITPKELVVRRPNDGICICTNHFCSKELSPAQKEIRVRSLDRYRTLEQAAEMEKLDVADLKRNLNAVANKTNTMHSMIFEPSKLRVYVAMGTLPASEGEFRLLELGPLFKKK